MIKISGVLKAVNSYNTPFYLYDESILVEKCREIRNMPNAFGLKVRYAMKANSSGAILQIIHREGLEIDASSLNEARRAYLAGIPYSKIMLTTQEVPEKEDRKELEAMMDQGLNYNVCSVRQLEMVSDYISNKGIPLSVRVHPGVGSGESVTRNTGDKYSCFGIHLSDLEKVMDYAGSREIVFNSVHVHIGSGGDPEKWKENIDRELGFIKKYFHAAETVNFGGGLKVARMPDETGADIKMLGEYAKMKIEEFYSDTGRKLCMEVEPGTFITANSGFLVTKVIDKKKTGRDGFSFFITDGGMETNARPLLYGSRHPFYIVSADGELLSSDNNPGSLAGMNEHIIAGRCCESGDSQCLDDTGHIVPRKMAEPETGDYIIVGGCGAYCSAMTPFNYNSHVQAAEVLLRTDGRLNLIRKEQSLNQIVSNELALQD